MSRSDPYKKKRRVAKETYLLCGEGRRDLIFLRHIKNLYSRENDLRITIVNANGGSIPTIINYVRRLLGGFSKRIVMLDIDKSEEEIQKGRKIANDNGIILIENSPCLEMLFLLILDIKCSNLNSQQCKSKFEKETLADKDENIEQFNKMFPKKILDIKRVQIDNLDKIIRLIENDQSKE